MTPTPPSGADPLPGFDTRPRSGRIRLRMLLLAPVLAAFVHCLMVTALGREMRQQVCLDCGMRVTTRVHRAFGIVRIGEADQLRDTAFSRLLRAELGFACRSHRWASGGQWTQGGWNRRLSGCVVSGLASWALSNVNLFEGSEGEGALIALSRADPAGMRKLMAVSLDLGVIDQRSYIGSLARADLEACVHETLKAHSRPWPDELRGTIGVYFIGGEQEWDALARVIAVPR